MLHRLSHFICLAFCATLMMGASAAQANSMSAQDFVNKAAIANKFEIETSQLAVKHSTNPKVKDFAQQMIDDHTKTGMKLTALLKSGKADIKVPDTLDAKHENLLKALQTTPKENFDSRYIDIQEDAHKEAVDLFGSYSKNGEDATLKAFAAETLPALKQHYKHVKALK